MAAIRLFGVDIGTSETALKLSNAVSGGKRKRNNVARKKVKRSVKRRGADDQEPEPPIPAELLQNIRTREGATEPVFLYKKKLEESDVKKDQHRLFVTRREGFEKFLNDGENAVLHDRATKGLHEIVGVDARGSLYKLGLNIWSSINVLVINSDWSKLVKQNNVVQGDWVQIWGHRQMGNLCLAINFEKA